MPEVYDGSDARDDVAALRREPVDPLTYVAVALLTATLLASYVPARRISRIDPAVTMRVE
jgi:hypothetical protein